jgi:hypothetical protein
MSDHYKHISEKAARKAADALALVKAEQRAEARAKIARSETAAEKPTTSIIQADRSQLGMVQ